MDVNLHKALVDFKINGTLPASFPSNKSNWITYAKKFSLTLEAVLVRDGKIVAREDQLDGDICQPEF